MPRFRPLAVVALAASVASLLASLPACTRASAPPRLALALAEPPRRGPDPARFHVLMINGGGNPQTNYRAHLLDLETLHDLALASGIAEANIAIFSSDGADPGPDVVTRDPQPESDFWLLKNTRLERPLGARRQLATSDIPGAHLEPATKAALRNWFAGQSGQLRAGDTLLLYVTDHGNRTGADPLTNTIQLWGDEQLSGTELRALLSELPRGVRLVNLMSQCFAGGFAALSLLPASSAPAPDVCGYFASTPDRPAYGCFPENIGKERVGYSFHFFRALAASRRMRDAHAEVETTDDSPDVPLRSSDFFLRDVLERTAKAQSLSLGALVSRTLGSELPREPEFREERALLARITNVFGLRAVEPFTNVAEDDEVLSRLAASFESSGRAWGAALADVTAPNLTDFVTAKPEWSARLADPAVQGLSADPARALAASLLGELGPWTRVTKGESLDVLERRRALAEDAGYRSEVRLAAIARVRILLTSIAGRKVLEGSLSTPADREHYAALLACEDVELPAPASSPPADAEVESPRALSAMAEDELLEREVRPAWLGISFQGVRDEARKEHALSDGASMVNALYPRSPAAEGGLEPGDIILGTPGHGFSRPSEIRTWTMLSTAGSTGRLEVLRGDAKKPIELSLTPRPMPLDLGALPAPAGPVVAMPAPPLAVRAYRGDSVRLADGKPHLLFFWATWCGPCKASLPEVLAFERTHHTQVVAIANEPVAAIDKFFSGWKKPFPKTVAVDEMNRAFLAYGVTSIPSFVLVDERGIVRARSAGYASPPGLPIEGWKWDGKAAK